jgi:hypothetical protein
MYYVRMHIDRTSNLRTYQNLAETVNFLEKLDLADQSIRIALAHLLTIVLRKGGQDCLRTEPAKREFVGNFPTVTSEKATMSCHAFPLMVINSLDLTPYAVVSDAMGPAEPICRSYCITCTYLVRLCGVICAVVLDGR